MSTATGGAPDVVSKTQVLAAWAMERDLYPIAVRAVLILAFFGNTIDVEEALNPKVGINPQAIGKSGLVVAAGILGAIGWWRLSAVRALLLSPVGMLSIAISLLGFLTSITSIDPKVSLSGTVAFTSYLLLVLTALVIYGPNRLLKDAVIALFLFLCAVWVAFLFVPDIGVYVEAAGTNQVSRMSGLGHPNALGRSASLLAILLIAGYRQGHYPLWITVFGGAFGLLSLLESFSRTAMVACFASILFFNRDWLRSRLFLVLLGPAVFVGMAAVLYTDNRYGLDRGIQKVLVGSSKTGDAEEITSATGRTIIWAESWKLIKQSPITGYGSGTSPLLLENYSHHTHNILLNPMLSMGLLGGLIVLVWLMINIKTAFTTTTDTIGAIVSFILISGLTENTILSTYPETCTLSWLIASFWPYLNQAKDMATLRNSQVPSPRFGEDNYHSSVAT
jgi:exopolysaccharide production protein ExoQ